MSKAAELRQQTYRGTHMRDSKGVYTWKDERFPSITTLLKVLDKPALVRWAPKMVAEHVQRIAVDTRDFVNITVPAEKLGWPVVRQHLDTVLSELADADAIKNVPWAYSEKKRDLGSTFHDIAEQIAGGTPINPDVFADDVRPLVRGFMQFVDDEMPEFLAMETGVFNRSIGYACTLDTIVDLPRRKRRVVIDYKASADSYPEHSLQLAAQRFAEFVGLRDGSEIEMPETDGTMILCILPDGYRLLEWETQRSDLDDIGALVRLYQRNQRKLKYSALTEKIKEVA